MQEGCSAASSAARLCQCV